MVKRTFSLPDEKEEIYAKFKKIVPEVSGAIMEMIEQYVRKHEALQVGMKQQKAFKGKHDLATDTFVGQDFSFYGIDIASGVDLNGTDRTVYFTRKGKFLVSGVDEIEHVKHYGFSVYETYEQLAEKIPSSLLIECQNYLNINSNVRTSIELDI